MAAAHACGLWTFIVSGAVFLLCICTRSWIRSSALDSGLAAWLASEFGASLVPERLQLPDHRSERGFAGSRSLAECCRSYTRLEPVGARHCIHSRGVQGSPAS